MSKGRQITAKRFIPQRARVYGKDVLGTRKTKTAVMLVFTDGEEHEEVYLSAELASALAMEMGTVIRQNQGEDTPVPLAGQENRPTPARMAQALSRHPELLWEVLCEFGPTGGPWHDEDGTMVRTRMDGKRLAEVDPDGKWRIHPVHTLVTQDGVNTTLEKGMAAADEQLRTWSFHLL